MSKKIRRRKGKAPLKDVLPKPKAEPFIAKDEPESFIMPSNIPVDSGTANVDFSEDAKTLIDVVHEVSADKIKSILLKAPRLAWKIDTT